jgi:hypothetical protein
LESIYLRAYELVAKVSFVLAAAHGVRTVEHVRWAYALVKRDIESKMHLVVSNDGDKNRVVAALQSAIAHAVGDEGLTIGVLRNRLSRKWKREDIDSAVDRLLDAGHLKKEVVAYGRGDSRSTERIFLV